MDELLRVSKGPSSADQNPYDRELTAEEDRQSGAFNDANQFADGRADIMPGDMDVGGTLMMGGESLKLIGKGDEMATFEDGPKYGTQRVPLDHSLWFDVDDSPFLPEEDAAAESIVDDAEIQGYESADELIDQTIGVENSGNPADLSEGKTGPVAGGVPDDRGASAQGEGGSEVAKPSFYLNGDRAEYTGETTELAGATLYVGKMVEGHRKGEAVVTQTRPDGTSPNDGKFTAAWHKQQEEFKRLKENQDSEAAAASKRIGDMFGTKKPPASKMDVKNADSRELFADDGGFQLGQDNTVDGAKIVAERKAKEDAKAAQDAAQGDMFAKPVDAPLTPEEQALADSLKGLFSSPSRESESDDLFAPEDLKSPELAKVKMEGTKSALGAYRALTAKKNAGKSLTPDEHETLLQAESALGQKMAFDMAPDNLSAKQTELVKAALAEAVKPQQMTSRSSTQQSMSLGPETLKSGQGTLFSSPSREPDTDYDHPIPAAALPKIMQALAPLIESGKLETPQDMAAVLGKLGAQKLSQRLWGIAASFQGKPVERVDWAELYNPQKQVDTPSNDIPSSTNLEPNRGRAIAGDGSGKPELPLRPGSTGDDGRQVDGRGEKGRDIGSSGPLSADVPSAPHGKQGNLELSPAKPPTGVGASRDSGAAGRGGVDDSGLQVESERTERLGTNLSGTPSRSGSLVGGGTGSLKTGESSPLTPEQHDDVAFVEKRLREKGKPGVLLTNGTGTGKTFSGLGAITKALDAGAKHILVVAPSDKVCGDWKSTAQEFFGIHDAHQLTGTKDNGDGNRLIVTTYANLRDNSNLVNREWDMVVADEAHYLSQSRACPSPA